VVIFGAGGPLAAISVRALERDHVLRLCDLRPLGEIAAEGKPQSRGAPVPRVLQAPHEMRVVDVTDYQQVLEATRGMDAVINMTVMRHDPVEAFRVNTLGAYNVIRAAVECGIRRVVQTGPQQVTNTMPGGYWSDTDLSSSVPPRPGVELYFISKFLGHEIVRVFAQEHDLEAPLLVFGPFTNRGLHPDQLGCYPFRGVVGRCRRSWCAGAQGFDRPLEVFRSWSTCPTGGTDGPHESGAALAAARLLDVHWRQPTG
jgi:nucleoside-diphosphate-sugar epimerase